MDWIMRLNNIERFEKGKTIMKIKMGNADIECAWTGSRIKTANASSHIEVTVGIFRHILDLFKFSEKIQLDLLLDSDDVQNFPALEGVTSTALRGGSINTSAVETFCSKYPSPKSMSLFTRLSGELSPNSPVLAVKEVFFHDPGSQSSTILEKFTGRILMIDNAQLPEVSIIHFIRNWMTGSSHQNLEVLSVFFDKFPINLVIVHEEFKNEAKVFDPSKRQEDYEFNTQFKVQNRIISASSAATTLTATNALTSWILNDTPTEKELHF
ncbi:hypothetical protein CAEBREN_04190 [Caenorhabditis brenneri]|uniref:F-box associated domain-containing protein n=1 Tax=Caenorhabditis brenneri TaxID=135651 RepID=G0MKS6_CAEBE|nr:hypothetical protein CAEBREN_04190 [Caenorhabditis brenneri]